MSRKNVPSIYTKTFGGKIWANLHSVYPDNFLNKKVKMASLIISRQKLFEHHLVQKTELKENVFSTRKNIRQDLKPKLLVFVNLFLTEMILQIKTFSNRFSFAPQDKLNPKGQEIWIDTYNFSCCFSNLCTRPKQSATTRSKEGLENRQF